MPRLIRTNATSYSHLIAELMTGASSVQELIKITGLADATIRDHIYALRARKVCRISGWERGNRYIRPVYSLCSVEDHKDVPKPKKKSEAERTRDYRARKRLRLLQFLPCSNNSERYNAPVPTPAARPSKGVNL